MIVQMFIQIVTFSSFRYIFRSGMAKSFDDLCLIIWGTPILFDTTERHHFHFSLSCIGEGNGNPLQCSCLENPRDGGAWWAAMYGVAQSWTQLKRLSSSSSSSYLHLCPFIRKTRQSKQGKGNSGAVSLRGPKFYVCCIFNHQNNLVL